MGILTKKILNQQLENSHNLTAEQLQVLPKLIADCSMFIVIADELVERELI